MKLAVIGSRGFCDFDVVKEVLDSFHISEIISGGATGADSLAEKYANDNNIRLTTHLPDWATYGKSAAAIRNRKIVGSCDFIVAFWDGKSRGTKMVIDMANEIKKDVVIINVKA